jgi:type II secretory ATPase GspE/PulE/Tfp pilus assembly ATPase PilB-like protein
MRVIPTDIPTLELLGLPPQLADIAELRNGLVLVTGPTGSGKSSTLYACLHEIDRYQLNVITIENPVEYRLDNITQIEVNPRARRRWWKLMVACTSSPSPARTRQGLSDLR